MPIGFGSGKARGKPIFRLDADIRRLATGAATAGVSRSPGVVLRGGGEVRESCIPTGSDGG